MLGTIPRHIWAGLSVAWLVILATNIWPSDHSRTVATRSSEPSPEMMLAFWRQERLLAELIEPHPLRVLPPPKPALPAPRSQRALSFVPPELVMNQEFKIILRKAW